MKSLKSPQQSKLSKPSISIKSHKSRKIQPNSTLVSSSFSPVILRAELVHEARALGIHTGFAEIISEKVSSSIEKYLSTHPVVTERELSAKIIKEISKYHQDLAYIYRNRDKII